MPDVNSNGDGRAFVAGWIVKLIAGAAMTASIAWASWQTGVDNTQNESIVVLETNRANDKQQLDRIEQAVKDTRDLQIELLKARVNEP